MAGESKTARPLLDQDAKKSVQEREGAGRPSRVAKAHVSTSSSHSISGATPAQDTDGPALRKRFSRVPLRASAVQGYFKIGDDTREDDLSAPAAMLSKWNARNTMKVLVLIIIIYNIIFIPLQMAFRIKYTSILVVMEVLTVLIYGLDIYFRVKNLRALNKARGNLPESTLEYEATMMDNIEHFKKRTSALKVEIVSSCFAIVPFSLCFQVFDYHEPLLVCNPLCLLRLVKVLPMIKLFDHLRSEHMQKFRILEVMITYYVINHVLTCIWLSMGLHAADVRETWIRRLPHPQGSGMRVSKTADDLSAWTLYIHSLYFNVNTVSHVAVGDITAVTLTERLYVAILILFGTFAYCFLFGNIVSIVSDFAPNQQHNYFEKYQFIQ